MRVYRSLMTIGPYNKPPVFGSLQIRFQSCLLLPLFLLLLLKLVYRSIDRAPGVTVRASMFDIHALGVQFLPNSVQNWSSVSISVRIGLYIWCAGARSPCRTFITNHTNKRKQYISTFIHVASANEYYTHLKRYFCHRLIWHSNISTYIISRIGSYSKYIRLTASLMTGGDTKWMWLNHNCVEVVHSYRVPKTVELFNNKNITLQVLYCVTDKIAFDEKR